MIIMFSVVLEQNPIAKKQLRCSCIHGKPKMYQPSSKDQQRMAEIFKYYVGFSKPFECPVKQIIRIYVPIPKSTSKVDRWAMMNGKIRPDKKPDIDNYAYMITNAGTGIFYDDDKRICSVQHDKFYDDGKGPRTEICIDAI